MYYKTEFDLHDFPAWSGGRDTLETLKEKNLVDEIQTILEDIYRCEEAPTDTEINDFLWFERDTIAEWLGFSSWEALEHGEEEAEDEDEGNEEESAFSAFCDSFAACENCPYKECKTMDECRAAFKADHKQ